MLNYKVVGNIWGYEKWGFLKFLKWAVNKKSFGKYAGITGKNAPV